jgi:hypothetical protein
LPCWTGSSAYDDRNNRTRGLLGSALRLPNASNEEDGVGVPPCASIPLRRQRSQPRR